jgi:hypothetical protein
MAAAWLIQLKILPPSERLVKYCANVWHIAEKKNEIQRLAYFDRFVSLLRPTFPMMATEGLVILRRICRCQHFLETARLRVSETLWESDEVTYPTPINFGLCSHVSGSCQISAATALGGRYRLLW